MSIHMFFFCMTLHIVYSKLLLMKQSNGYQNRWVEWEEEIKSIRIRFLSNEDIQYEISSWLIHWFNRYSLFLFMHTPFTTIVIIIDERKKLISIRKILVIYFRWLTFYLPKFSLFFFRWWITMRLFFRWHRFLLLLHSIHIIEIIRTIRSTIHHHHILLFLLRW